MTVTDAAGIRDLRSSLEVLERGGRLHRIDGPVNLDCELGTVAFEVEKRGIGAVLFNQPARDPSGPYHPDISVFLRHFLAARTTLQEITKDYRDSCREYLKQGATKEIAEF
ncbi:MAG: UbiD family decarboxylase, partial [Nitrospinota bacterium]|nr:UbiD family decarboxylase [Nitrospinota bacterium]